MSKYLKLEILLPGVADLNVNGIRMVHPIEGTYHRIAVYFRYTKPRVWILLVYTAAIGSVVAVSAFDFQSLIFILLAVVATALGSAGSEALTNFIDRDMDSVMSRTRNRPLPSGEIGTSKAVTLGFILIAASILLLMAFQKFYAAAFMALGIFDNVIVYSYLLKRKTPWSIILGGFSGGFPAVIGWYCITTQFSLIPWFLFALVVAWIPIHVWSLAFRYRDDYTNAGVPMLPVLYSKKVSAWCISGSAIILAIFSIIPFIFGIQTVYYLLVVSILAVPMFALSMSFIKYPDIKGSFRLFKYSSPYLAVVFTLFVIFRIF